MPRKPKPHILEQNSFFRRNGPFRQGEFFYVQYSLPQMYDVQESCLLIWKSIFQCLSKSHEVWYINITTNHPNNPCQHTFVISSWNQPSWSFFIWTCTLVPSDLRQINAGNTTHIDSLKSAAVKMKKGLPERFQMVDKFTSSKAVSKSKVFNSAHNNKLHGPGRINKGVDEIVLGRHHINSVGKVLRTGRLKLVFPASGGPTLY